MVPFKDLIEDSPSRGIDSSGSLPSRIRAGLASKYACRYSKAKSDLVSYGGAEGRALKILECQSKHVPMKSNKIALMRISESVFECNIFGKLLCLFSAIPRQIF
jgi:hypothetical protein